MSYIVNTILNREVDNLWESWKDAVLYVLHQWHYNPLNDDLPMNIDRIKEDLSRIGIENITNQQIEDMCKKLCNEKLLEHIPAGSSFYKISPDGIEYVEKLLTKV